MRAYHFRAGDKLVRSNGTYVIVEFVQHEILEQPVKVYNFEVDEFHTYHVGENGFWVHNICGKRNTPDQEAVIDLAQEYKKTGIILEEAEILWDWAKEYGLAELSKANHGPKFDSYLGGSQLHEKINGEHINIF